MHLSSFDWAIIGGLVLLFLGIGLWTKRYTRSVSGFLAADRCGGRYLLSTAYNIAGVGAITFVATWEANYEAGRALGWWGLMMYPLAAVVGLSGWVIYRYRRTRALTMGQFFEIRYSRKFRLFASIIAWTAGVMSYGLAPAITARFLVAFCGFPSEVSLLGVTVPTIAPVMLIMLSFALFLTFCGGQIAVMVTDFLQGQLVIVGLTVIAIVLIGMVGWDNFFDTMKQRPAGKSMLNPFDIGDMRDFNIWLILMSMFTNVYNHCCWPERQAYFCSAKSAHEAKMSSVLGIWRTQLFYAALGVPALCVWVLMHNSSFSADAAVVTQSLQQFGEAQIQKQMTVPVGLSHMLPWGMMGLFAVMIMSAAVTTDDTSLHAWGSLLVQDIVMPFRKKPLPPKTHMLLLRMGIVGVAVFAFFFGLFFPVRDYLTMLLYILSSLYLAGAGICLIGGLYWKRGTTAGAWCAMILGAVLAISGVVVRTWWADIPVLRDWRETCPLNGMHMGFFAAVTVVVVYVVVSLLTGGLSKPFDLDKMLHRKRDENGNLIEEKSEDGKKKLNRKKGLLGLIGITEEFTRGDTVIFILSICWTLFWVIAFIIGTVYGLLNDTTEDTWIPWWKLTTIIGLALGLIWGVWFCIGGAFDLRYLFKKLASAKEDTHDDGWVEKGQPESEAKKNRNDRIAECANCGELE